MPALQGEVREGAEEGRFRAVTRVAPEAAVRGLGLMDHGAEQRAVPLARQRLPVEVVGRRDRALVRTFTATVLMDDDATDGLDAFGNPEVVGRGKDEPARER